MKRRRYKRIARGRTTGRSLIGRFQASNAAPFVKIGLALLGVVLIAALIFAAFSYINRETAPLNPTQEGNQSLPDGAQDGITDLSYLQHDAFIDTDMMSSLSMCGDEIVFSKADSAGRYTELMLYDCGSETSTAVNGITLKYDNIIGCKLTKDYIIWIETLEAGGGRICAYDREKREQFVIKEFAFAAPKINTSGNKIIFMQQAGDNLDRLYLYDLDTRESACPVVLKDLPAVVTAADISETDYIYAVPYQDGDAVKSTVYRTQLATGETEKINWNRYILRPMTDGVYIAFLTPAEAGIYDLYVDKGKNTPVLIENDIVNFDMGEGYIAYTKAQSIYIYLIETGSKFRISPQDAKALLAGVNGSELCWYDVTAGYDSPSRVKYAKVSW